MIDETGMAAGVRLVRGDCLELLRCVPDASVDAVISDLPYGTTSCHWDEVIPFASLWSQLLRVGKENAAFVFTASQPFTSLLVTSNLGMFRHEWIWQKNRGSNFANTVREPFKEHESVLVFSKGRWTYNKQMQERSGGGADRARYAIRLESSSENYRKMTPRVKETQTEMRVPSSVQKFNTEVGLHPTQKPVALMRYLIRTYTNKGDTVLDVTMGSGTTGVAAVLERRKFIGMEKDEGYFRIAKERIERETRQGVLDL